VNEESGTSADESSSAAFAKISCAKTISLSIKPHVKYWIRTLINVRHVTGKDNFLAFDAKFAFATIT